MPRFVAALQIASAILRNSELVDDIELKHRAYGLITGYWCEVLIGVLVTVDFLEDDSRELEAIASLLPLNNPALAAYFLKVIAPTVVMSVALECLGTAKLQLIMERSLRERTEAVRQVLDTFLYTDLELPDRFSYLDALLRKYEGNRFIGELIFFKIGQIFMFRTLSDTDEATVRKILARSIGVIVSADSQVAKDRLKNRVLADLEKKRLTQSPGPAF
jgi:hypothetical protein